MLIRTFKNHVWCGAILCCAKLSHVPWNVKHLWLLPTNCQQCLWSFLKSLVRANHIKSINPTPQITIHQSRPNQPANGIGWFENRVYNVMSTKETQRKFAWGFEEVSYERTTGKMDSFFLFTWLTNGCEAWKSWIHFKTSWSQQTAGQSQKYRGTELHLN